MGVNVSNIPPTDHKIPTGQPAAKFLWVPDRKVLAMGISGVFSWLALTLATPLLNKYGIWPPPGTQEQLAGLIALLMAWAVPPADKDIIGRIDNRLVALAQADKTNPTTTPVVTQAEAIPVIVGTQTPGSATVTPVNPTITSSLDKGPQE